VNNSLAFPGIFRGALDARVRNITDEMKIAAAPAILPKFIPTPATISRHVFENNFRMS
jgi:malate dehydrogenase (oxaloacetate-decarboxylating)